MRPLLPGWRPRRGFVNLGHGLRVRCFKETADDIRHGVRPWYLDTRRPIWPAKWVAPAGALWPYGRLSRFCTRCMDGMLKDLYRPKRIHDLVYRDSPFLALLPKGTAFKDSRIPVRTRPGRR